MEIKTFVIYAHIAIACLIGYISAIDVPPSVFRDAEFAVEELKRLSDSGIYSSLSLANILDYEEIDGIYHDNVALELELRSNYFKSKQETEVFNMVVMKHKKEEITTLAIDEFPVMDDDAIEEFYIDKVEENRENREKAFERLYRQSLTAEPPSVIPTPSPLSANQANHSAPNTAIPQATASNDKENMKKTAEVGVSANGALGAVKTKKEDGQSLDTLSLQELHVFLSNPLTPPEVKKSVQQIIKKRYAKK